MEMWNLNERPKNRRDSLRQRLCTRRLLMLAVCFPLGLGSLTSVSGWPIFSFAILVLGVWNLNAAGIILGSAGLGWLLFQAPL